MIKLIYYGRLPGNNSLINCNRANKYYAAKIKKDTQRDLAMIFRAQAKKQKPIETHCTAYLTFWERDNRRDDDNVWSGGSKVIMDSIVWAGILKDDSPKYVHVLPERLTCAGNHQEKIKNERIEIMLVEDGEGIDEPFRKYREALWNRETEHDDEISQHFDLS